MIPVTNPLLGVASSSRAQQFPSSLATQGLEEVRSETTLATQSVLSVVDPDYAPDVPEVGPHFPTQQEFDELVKEMGLTKDNALLLCSRLKQWNLLDPSVRITAQRTRHGIYSQYFKTADDVCYCFDIKGILHKNNNVEN